MANLTEEDIESLASRPGVRRIAVENFLGTLDGLTLYEATGNLKLDAKLYKWNVATVNAIQDGIDINFDRG